MATALPDGNPIPSQSNALMLAELKEAHERLLLAMSNLDHVTRGPLPAKDVIIDARWSIGRASLARRTVWNRIHDQLSNRASKVEMDDLRRLRECDMALLRSSSDHVAKWGIASVVQNWADYCDASRGIRWKMRAAMGAEQRVLYPMLDAS